MSALTEQVRKALKLEKDNTWKNVITYRERTAWLEELCDRVEELEKSTMKIAGMCGTPDAVEGCRNILSVAKEALRAVEWK